MPPQPTSDLGMEKNKSTEASLKEQHEELLRGCACFPKNHQFRLGMGIQEHLTKVSTQEIKSILKFFLYIDARYKVAPPSTKNTDATSHQYLSTSSNV